ncbi:hypothetical protein MMC20_000424 [Loxospora ochrophaea]|nr:hypothetical protein [Loxospora ochrophaea]
MCSSQVDLQHQIWQVLLEERLFTVPDSQISSLLDLGCGSAVWTAAVAARFPRINVLGVDITPIANEFNLENLTLIAADIEKPWSFATGQKECYDLISLRVLVSAIRDWPSLIRQCFEHLRPGAWIEIPDITLGTFSEQIDWQDESSPLMRWFQCYRKGAERLGIDGFASQKRTECLVTAQFTQISEKLFKCYLDENAVTASKDKEIARLAMPNMLGLLDAVTNVMQERGQWDLLNITSSELQQLKDDAKQDVIQNSASRRYHWKL